MSAAAAPIEESKAIATLVARACLAGYQLKPLRDGTFVVSRWDLFRELDSLADVEAFLKQPGAPAA